MFAALGIHQVQTASTLCVP